MNPSRPPIPIQPPQFHAHHGFTVQCTNENTVPVKLEAGGGAGDEGSLRRGDVVGDVTEYIHTTVVALHASCKPRTFIYTDRRLLLLPEAGSNHTGDGKLWHLLRY